MLINELSKRTGISAHTIRFYEKSGLIKGERKEDVKSNNYFHYDEDTVKRLELVGEAKSIGFSISEIGQLINSWYGNIYSKEEKLSILDEKLETIEQKIKELKEMKKRISRFKRDEC